MRLAATIIAASLALIAPATQAQTVESPNPSTVVTFTNELPSSYRLQRVRLVVDGAVRYDGPRFDTAYLPPGGHVVEVVADYKMHNAMLPYMNRYGVEVRSAHVVRPATHRINALAVHHGGATTPIERSAVIAWVDR